MFNNISLLLYPSATGSRRNFPNKVEITPNWLARQIKKYLFEDEAKIDWLHSSAVSSSLENKQKMKLRLFRVRLLHAHLLLSNNTGYKKLN